MFLVMVVKVVSNLWVNVGSPGHINSLQDHLVCLSIIKGVFIITNNDLNMKNIRNENQKLNIFKITLLLIESFLGGEVGSRRRVSGNSLMSIISTKSSSESSERLLLALVFADLPFLGGLL